MTVSHKAACEPACERAAAVHAQDDEKAAVMELYEQTLETGKAVAN